MSSLLSPISTTDSAESLLDSFNKQQRQQQQPSSPRPISPVLTPLNSTSTSDHLCTQCGTQFGNARMLALHIRVTHERASPWRCVHCAGLFGCSRQLSDHILKSHRGGTHKCVECTATFSSCTLLRQHEATHAAIEAERALHRCTMCNFASSSLGELRFHQFDKHPKHSICERRIFLLPAPPRRNNFALPPRMRMESTPLIVANRSDNRGNVKSSDGDSEIIGNVQNDVLMRDEIGSVDSLGEKENGGKEWAESDILIGKQPSQVPERVAPTAILQMRNVE